VANTAYSASLSSRVEQNAKCNTSTQAMSGATQVAEHVPKRPRDGSFLGASRSCHSQRQLYARAISALLVTCHMLRRAWCFSANPFAFARRPLTHTVCWIVGYPITMTMLGSRLGALLTSPLLASTCRINPPLLAFWMLTSADTIKHLWLLWSTLWTLHSDPSPRRLTLRPLPPPSPPRASR
jgi:hypothetical protein